ncbi:MULTISPECIES: hypothetical protein [Burkholderia]|nr:MULTISPECIES: hypothetical protein [Burkholderia]
MRKATPHGRRPQTKVQLLPSPAAELRSPIPATGGPTMQAT